MSRSGFRLGFFRQGLAGLDDGREGDSNGDCSYDYTETCVLGTEGTSRAKVVSVRLSFRGISSRVRRFRRRPGRNIEGGAFWPPPGGVGVQEIMMGKLVVV